MKTRTKALASGAVLLALVLTAALLIWHLRDAPSQSAERNVWDDVGDMYRNGKIAEAREKGMGLVQEWLADLKETVKQVDELEKLLKKAEDSEDENLRKSVAERLNSCRGRLTNLPGIAMYSASSLLEREHRLFSSKGETQDEESRKFVDELVDIVEEANSIANKVEQQWKDDEAWRKMMRDQIDRNAYYRERAILNQIRMSDPKRAEELFAKHEEFLSSRGIAKKDVIKGEKTAQEKEADKMLAMVKKDEAEIRENLVQFYDALTKSDEDKLRRLLVKEQTPDEIINSPKRKREQEKLGFDSFTMQMDKQSTIRFVRYENGYVLVAVSDVLVTLTTDGVEKSHRQSHLIRLKREDKEWRIWFPY